MNRIVMTLKVSRDGMLHLSVPIGWAKFVSQAEWSAWVDSLAGSWQGEVRETAAG